MIIEVNKNPSTGIYEVNPNVTPVGGINVLTDKLPIFDSSYILVDSNGQFVDSLSRINEVVAIIYKVFDNTAIYIKSEYYNESDWNISWFQQYVHDYTFSYENGNLIATDPDDQDSLNYTISSETPGYVLYASALMGGSPT